MKILVDENKYLTCFCVDAELKNGIEVETPEDIDSFIGVFRAYKYENGRLVLDENKLNELKSEYLTEELRLMRYRVCFPVVNRGELWYSKLDDEKMKELDVWYQAWLDVTDTKVVPETPEWLNNV